jgi:hypothetical protein
MQSIKLTYKACLVYLADASVVGRTLKEQPDNLHKVFQRFPRANVKLNHEKCQVFLKKVQ